MADATSADIIHSDQTQNSSPADEDVSTQNTSLECLKLIVVSLSHQIERRETVGQHEIIEASKYGHVDNLFMHWSVEAVDEVTQKFVEIFGLRDHERLFKMAGRVLRDPDNWRLRVWNDLQPKERVALNRESLGFREQPKQLKMSTVMFCLGALVQGWSQTTGNGANVGWPEELKLKSFQSCELEGPAHDQLNSFDVWMFALVNASSYLAASMIGCWLSDPLSDLFLGRRTPVFISAGFILGASIGCATSENWKQLLACRILLGVGMGCKATVLPVCASEIAPSHLRGTLVVNWQIFVALGICLGFAANLIVIKVGPGENTAWKWQNAALCFPTLALLVLVYVCPESPRFQMRSRSNLWGGSLRAMWSGERGIWSGRRGLKPWLVNIAVACFWFQPDPMEEASAPRPVPADPSASQYEQAFDSLVQLRGDPILAAKELLYTHVQMVVETYYILNSKHIEDRPTRPGEASSTGLEHHPTKAVMLEILAGRLSYFRKLLQLWTIPRLRRATGSALVCMLSQQFCGVNVLIFYCTTLYASSDLCRPDKAHRDKAFSLSFGIGVVNFLFAIPAYWLIHRWGRRSLLLTTLPFMTVFMLGACLGFQQQSKEDQEVHTRILAIFTFLFMAAYSVGMGPVPFTLSSEVFPLEYRMVGMSLSVSANLLGAGVLALIVPPIYSTRLGNQGLLAIITVLNTVAFLLILLFVRETAGTTDPGRNKSRRAMSLEDLSYIFSVATDVYLQFQWKELRPWVLRYPSRLIRRIRKGVPIEERPRIQHTRQAIELENMSSSTRNASTSSGSAR